jgi:hypothetical protein
LLAAAVLVLAHTQAEAEVVVIGRRLLANLLVVVGSQKRHLW